MKNNQKYLEILNNIRKQDNMFYSPLSINIAMSLYSKIIEKGPAYDEIMNFLDNEDYSNYQTKSNFKVVNALWANKDRHFDLSRISIPNIFEISMQNSREATKQKDKYVKKHTDGFITATPTILCQYTTIDLMNVIYFKDTWSSGELMVDNGKTDFHNFDDTVTPIRMMNATSSYYFENDTCYIIPISYTGGMTYNLVYAKNDIKDVNYNDLKRVNNKAIIKLPAFETNINFDLIDYAKALGIPNMKNSELIFESQESRDSGPSETHISHTARIKVDPKGTEAAAVTEFLRVRGRGVPKEEEPLRLIFNKPFYYTIEDNDDTIFIGRLAKL